MNIMDVYACSPALARYEQEALFGKVWSRAGLSRRDRSIVTLAAVITQGRIDALPFYANFALDHGVAPKEMSEIVTHLAFYAGWCTGTTAAAAIGRVFADRAIGEDQLPAESPALMPLDMQAEARRAQAVEQMVGTASPGLVADTGAVLFRDLWLRPDLSPRDRSLVTVASLITAGHVAQVTFHLNKAMDNGLKPEEVSEAVSHLAWYAGWPNAFSAVPVVRSVLESRAGGNA